MASQKSGIWHLFAMCTCEQYRDALACFLSSAACFPTSVASSSALALVAGIILLKARDLTGTAAMLQKHAEVEEMETIAYLRMWVI